MKKYHYDADEDCFDETKRLDDINQEVKKIVADKSANAQKVEESLGDSNAFLDNFETEKFVVTKKESTNEPMNDKLQGNLEDENEDEAEKQHRFKILVTIASILCILLFIGVFALVKSGISGNKKSPLTEQNTDNVQGNLLLVKAVTDKAEILIHDTAEGTDYTIQTDENTQFLDRNGQETTIKEFSSGDLIAVTLQDGTRRADSVFFSGEAWLKTDVSGLQVNAETKSINIADKKKEKQSELEYSSDTLFSYQDKSISPGNIIETDIVQMQGYKNTVWSLQVLEYHGYITIKNTDKIQNGMFQLDEQQPIPLQDIESFPAAEGVHKVVITGSNIETRTDEIYIIPEEATILDMSIAQSKTGVLILQCKVPGFKLYINGQETNGEKPIVLGQGSEYDIVILAKGYKQWNRKIVLDQASLTIPVELEEDISKGTVHFSSVPSGATIYLDSVNIGTTPLQRELQYGTYNIIVELEGYNIYSETTTVNKPSETISYRLELMDTEE